MVKTVRFRIKKTYNQTQIIFFVLKNSHVQDLVGKSFFIKKKIKFN